jgi:hypothetical protein
VIDNNWAQTTMHRLLSDLTPLLHSGRADRWLVMGGDLNVSTQLPRPYGDWSKTIFQRIADFGLVDLIEQAAMTHGRPGMRDCPCGLKDCLHVQTAKHSTGSHYQNDYMFATPALAELLDDCIPATDDEAWELSDHRPLIAEFRL